MPEGRPKRPSGSGATAVRILVILAAVGCCLAAAAYAYATNRSSPPSSEPPNGSRPLRPRITLQPGTETTAASVEVAFSQPGRPLPHAHRDGPPLRFECRLDDGLWESCSTPVELNAIAPGAHRFAVRAVNRAGREGPAAGLAWRRARARVPASTSAPAPEAPSARPTSPAAGSAPSAPPANEAPDRPRPVEEPQAPPSGLPFKIEQVGSVSELLPGAPAQTIALRVENPNPSPITVTSLSASIASEPPECPVAENFVLTQPTVSAAAPLVVPAESTVSLAEVGSTEPTIEMVNLPTNQDACQEAELEIALTGKASG